jgi:hypothetical protein
MNTCLGGQSKSTTQASESKNNCIAFVSRCAYVMICTGHVVDDLDCFNFGENHVNTVLIKNGISN